MSILHIYELIHVLLLFFLFFLFFFFNSFSTQNVSVDYFLKKKVVVLVIHLNLSKEVFEH